jgi:hypothetical protein
VDEVIRMEVMTDEEDVKKETADDDHNGRVVRIGEGRKKRCKADGWK